MNQAANKAEHAAGKHADRMLGNAINVLRDTLRRRANELRDEYPLLAQVCGQEQLQKLAAHSVLQLIGSSSEPVQLRQQTLDALTQAVLDHWFSERINVASPPAPPPAEGVGDDAMSQGVGGDDLDRDDELPCYGDPGDSLYWSGILRSGDDRDMPFGIELKVLSQYDRTATETGMFELVIGGLGTNFSIRYVTQGQLRELLNQLEQVARVAERYKGPRERDASG